MKQFDIYLQNRRDLELFVTERLTQCDILLHTIPYQDNLSVADTIVLHSCLDEYYLLISLAGRTNLELGSQVRDAILNIHARLAAACCPNATAELFQHSFFRAASYCLGPQPDLVSVQSASICSGQSAAVAQAAVVDGELSKSIGGGSDYIEPVLSLTNSLKTAYARHSAVARLTAALHSEKESFEQATNLLCVTAPTVSLLNQVYETAETSMAIDAEATVEMHHPLGGLAPLQTELLLQLNDTDKTSLERFFDGNAMNAAIGKIGKTVFERCGFRTSIWSQRANLNYLTFVNTATALTTGASIKQWSSTIKPHTLVNNEHDKGMHKNGNKVHEGIQNRSNPTGRTGRRCGSQREAGDRR